MPKKMNARPFKEAREFIQSLNLKSQGEWSEYCKSGKKPEDIPANPNTVYKDKGWKGTSDFLGYLGKCSSINTKSFKEAREFIQSLNLKNQKEWSEYCKSGKKPKNIPSTPSRSYKEEWKGMGDFLGTGTIASFNKVYRTFEETREFVRSLNISSKTEWYKYCKSGKKPDDIPANPNRTYKKTEEWINWGDFLGTGRIADQDREYRSFEEAREFAQSLNLKSGSEWNEYCKSGEKPDDVPTNANQVYKDNGWKGIGDFLGTGSIADQDRVYRSFEEAREFARSLNLNSGKEWYKHCKSGNKPDDIPTNAYKTYKKEWKGMGDFLGTGNIANYNKEYRPFEEAREFAKSLNLKSQGEWREYCKSSKKPEDIPANPNVTYKDSGWKGIGDFLGTGNVAPKNRVYRSFEEAKKFIRSLNLKSVVEWQEYCKSGKKPDDIPANPNTVYKIN